MEFNQDSLIAAIQHYQQALERYVKRGDETKILYTIGKLRKMPISVMHLEETGVGRTVNALRKHSSSVGVVAKALVHKWKNMVLEETTNSQNSSPAEDEGVESDIVNEDQLVIDDSLNTDENGLSTLNSNTKEGDKLINLPVEKSSKSFYKEEYRDQKKHDKHKSKKNDRDHENGKHKHSNHKSRSKEVDSDNSYNKKDEKKRESDKDKSKEKHSHKFSRERDSSEENRSKKHKSKHTSFDNPDTDDEKNKQSGSSSKSSKHKECSTSKKLKYLENDNKSSTLLKRKLEEDNEKKESKHRKKNIEKSRSDDEAHCSKHEHSDTNSKKMHKTDKQKNTDNVKERKHNSSKSKKVDDQNVSSTSVKKYSANGIDSESGTSFAEALGMCFPSSSKTIKKKVTSKKMASPVISSPEDRDNPVISTSKIQLEPLDINLVSNLLPEIKPNYRPIGNIPLNSLQPKNKMINEDAAMIAVMNSSRTRTKVYSGNKVSWNKVPTLFELCIRVLQDNIDALEYTGGVPYSVLKPVIERSNPDQLFVLEHHNPYLIDDTDELWQLFCQKEFRNKKREEMETWRDMYLRCLEEREAKLKALTANIKTNQDKSLPVRQTKLAYVDSVVKPPRSVLRKQAKHGTSTMSEKKPLVSPSDRLSSIIANSISTQVSVPNPGARASSSGHSTAVKPKKAPLMQKTLALMKNRHFKR